MDKHRFNILGKAARRKDGVVTRTARVQVASYAQDS